MYSHRVSPITMGKYNYGTMVYYEMFFQLIVRNRQEWTGSKNAIGPTFKNEVPFSTSGIVIRPLSYFRGFFFFKECGTTGAHALWVPARWPGGPVQPSLHAATLTKLLGQCRYFDYAAHLTRPRYGLYRLSV